MFFLSLSKYYHTKYWLASPPAMSHLTALKTMSKCQSWCLLLAGNENGFRTTCTFSQSPTQCQNGCGIGHRLLGRPQFSSARGFSCKLRRPPTQSDPQLLPKGQDNGTGTLGRWHHTWQGEAISWFPTPAPQLQAHSQPKSISLWEIWIYSKKPKATSLICHERSRTLLMA